MSISDLAEGRWREILPRLGVSAAFLTGKHGPCPMCAGKDRFRFDDKGGRGTWICGQLCGAGDGIGLLMRMHRWTYQEAAEAVQEIVGGVGARPNAPEPQKRDSRALLDRILAGCRPLEATDEAGAYLRERGLRVLPSVLGYHPRLAYFEAGKRTGAFPALVARVEGPSGDLRSVHCTYLDGAGKAAVPSPRKIMPAVGTINGASVRLFPAAEHLGVAEGLETSLAAHELFGLPVWAALNANGVEHFDPPSGVTKVTIFGDNDRNFAGQKAAYTAAHRLSLKGLEVSVKIPESSGWDFLDVLCNRPARNIGR